ncbi:transcription initiation factor TFIID subunit 2 [Eurytemora carolleeae]|uniref:transcription initiation factor TFIID subunit 2 n=1 Tax=Eurytemora carolleeae TaxID=1294199 RepID=UPI000C78C5D2|nr:transcription initiation factor TFIID subunit 2 [Eurytemora carolleeae]|eukprot:XP_023325811.1 transcription initiation factor TFIID subunit 2-like [Eurytemora affinis]
MTKKEKETRHYRVSHQILSLTGINFQTKSIIGCVELTLIPSRDNLKHIRLNAKQLRIYSVCLNGTVEASFQYFDPTLEVCQQNVEKRDLDTYSENHLSGCNLVDPDLNGGELNIKIPSEAFSQNMIGEGKPIRVRVEFSLEDPLGGVHFVLPEGEGTLAEKSAHMFTYGHENSARLWFPCIDTTSEPCTWKLEFTVDEVIVLIE